jgi:hypothetical protein
MTALLEHFALVWAVVTIHAQEVLGVAVTVVLLLVIGTLVLVGSRSRLPERLSGLEQDLVGVRNELRSTPDGLVALREELRADRLDRLRSRRLGPFGLEDH